MSVQNCPHCGKRYQSKLGRFYEPIILRLAKPIQRRHNFRARASLQAQVNSEGGLLAQKGPVKATVRWEMDAPPRIPVTPSTPPQA